MANYYVNPQAPRGPSGWGLVSSGEQMCKDAYLGVRGAAKRAGGGLPRLRLLTCCSL